MLEHSLTLNLLELGIWPSTEYVPLWLPDATAVKPNVNRVVVM